MLGLRLVTKRELMMYASAIETLDQDKRRLEIELMETRRSCDNKIEHERKRAEAAINALLIKQQKIAITPEPTPTELDQRIELEGKVLNIFGDEIDDRKFMEELQYDRTR